MRDYEPRRPTGYDAEARFDQAVYDRTHGPSAKVSVRGRGVRIGSTTKGVSVRLPFEPVGMLLGPYRFKDHFGDYIVCRTWDGTDEGTMDVYIAKPPQVRFSLLTQTIDGVVITYSAFDEEAQTRHASGDNGTEEDQVIYPRYAVDDLVYADRAVTLVQDPNGNNIFLLEHHFRGWMEVDDSSSSS